MSSTTEERQVWQPLHPQVRPRLDPQYVEVHDKLLQYAPPTHTQPWSAAMRQPSQASVKTGLDVVPVLTEEVQLERFTILVLTPVTNADDEPRPESGWPVFVWFHGGGFVLGDHSSELDLLTRICATARCVVCSVGYRLAPEHPYPAAIEDGTDGVRWILSGAQDGGATRFSIDRNRWAIGGVSAGALLSTVTLISLGEAGDLDSGAMARPLRQVLIVPVVDNTAMPGSGFWSINPHAISPSAERMLWYRRLWLGDADPRVWSVSVNHASDKQLAYMPPTFTAIGGEDLLAPEGLAFVDQLRGAGVDVETMMLPGCPHAILAFAGFVFHSTCAARGNGLLTHHVNTDASTRQRTYSTCAWIASQSRLATEPEKEKNKIKIV
ncbi:hypothetical protein MCOR27_005285 [Pyricularia oryzae]|uniref:Alpha/beta hydrolase fold-3 domain-containing protein n=1 Tax=Pyricularia grisea TaxID=148305 RepID=A0ABQ8NTZ7_PYRGI|nr:hypothetical protein MCOR01_009569 [Pyricularia oryzae]KAI6302096.1 hypothetical protein MCOR33_002555 [Pyricularia grisea]KAH9437160.1 hypothetical protein MCOR02_000814 [Pyricularia oryzae]KAI6260507.1 hypothetical protein MCOR19_003192 [Pyricularia oryzae]KAI6279147.1 hypothetical protein MCOR27_005285 [Pyricularia oryzae]